MDKASVGVILAIDAGFDAKLSKNIDCTLLFAGKKKIVFGSNSNATHKRQESN